MEINMSAQYTAADVQLVGDAKDVTFGLLGVGNYMSGEVQGFAIEFAADPADSIS